jgi:hypothetical protein
MLKWLTALVLSIVFNTSLSAKFVGIECVSGDCEVSLYADDSDFQKTLSSEEKPNISLALDIRPLIIEEDFNSTFKISAYEIEASGKKKMLASSDVLIPSDLAGKELMFKIRLDPFLGSKTIFFAVHRSDSSLIAVYKAIYLFNGSVPEKGVSPNNSDPLTPKISCNDDGFNECNLDSLFFNKIQFEESRSNSFRVRKNNEGIYKIGIPINRSERINTFSLNPRKPRPTKTENDKSEDNFDPEKILQLGRLGLGLSTPKALLEIAGAQSDIAPLKFNESSLVTQPLEGSFEFSNGELYFTRRGQRNHVVLSPFSSNIVIPAPPAQSPFAQVLESDNSANGLRLTGGHNVTFTSTGLSSLTLPTTGVVATLADIIPTNANVTALQSSVTTLQSNVTTLQSASALAEAKKLLDTNLINSMTLTGANDVALTTTGPTALTLPTTGVVATIADVVFAAVGAVPNNSITSIKIVDGSIVDADISATANIAASKLANTSITLGKMAANSVDSSKIVDASVASIDITDGTIVDADISATANIAASKLANTSITLGKMAPNSVDSSKIVDASVASIDITDGTIALVDLAANSVDSSKIVAATIVDSDISATADINGSKLLNGSVTAAKLASNIIVSASITDGTVALADLAANSVDSSKIVAGTIVDSDISATADINGSKLLNASVTAAKLASNVIVSASITDGTVALADLAANSVDSSKIVAGTIVDSDISATANINGSKLLNASIPLAKLAANAIDSSKITDGSVALADLAANSVDSSKIVDSSITSTDILDATIASIDIANGTIVDIDVSATADINGSKLLNASVPLAKMAANSVDSSKIVDATIMDGDIAVAANINGSKLLNASVVLAKMAADSVDSSKIVNASITGADIAAATITPDKLQTIQINTVSTNYTVIAGDLGKVLEVTAGVPITITLPTGLGAGFYVDIANISGVAITLAPGGGATLVSRAGLTGVSTQYGAVRLRTRTNTAWMASGDLN